MAAVLVAVTAVIGVLLTRVAGIGPAERCLAALTAGVVAAWLVGQPGRGRRRRGPEHRCRCGRYGHRPP
jgi:hypothetical protein